MNAEIAFLPVREQLRHDVRDGADADLQGGAVFDQLLEMLRDGAVLVRDRCIRQLEDGAVRFHDVIDLGDVNAMPTVAAEAEDARHVAIDFTDRQPLRIARRFHERVERRAGMESETHVAVLIHGGQRRDHHAWARQAGVALPAEEVCGQVLHMAAHGFEHAFDRPVEAADQAHAGLLQDRVGLDQQPAEDRQVAVIGALRQSRKKRGRLAGDDRRRQRILGLNEIDSFTQAAELAAIQRGRVTVRT